MEICERTFDDVVDHLTALNYGGPVGLSCDDTKLFDSMRLFWDAEKQAHFLVGCTDGPRRVVNPEEVRAVLKDPNLQKATKVRRADILPCWNLAKEQLRYNYGA